MNIKNSLNPSVNQGLFYTNKGTVPSKVSKVADASSRTLNEDSASISNQARSLLAENKELIKTDEKLEEFKRILEDLKESSNSNNNPLDSFVKCIEIAKRLMKGDKVPNQDIQFLAETQPEMFSSAMLLRKQNDHAKKHDSLLEDDENTSAIKVNLTEDNLDNIIDTSIEVEE